MPSSAVLIAARLPVNTSVASALPSPVVNDRPAVPASVSVPWVALSVTCIVSAPASTSPMLIACPFAVESTSGVFTAVTCRPGRWFTGASLTAVSVITVLDVAPTRRPAPGTANSDVATLPVSAPDIVTARPLPPLSCAWRTSTVWRPAVSATLPLPLPKKAYTTGLPSMRTRAASSAVAAKV